jgi:tetratricopeptide (TPR) repeat protein
MSIIEDAKQAFNDVGDVKLLAAVEAVAQQKAGKPELAKLAMERALQGGTVALPDATVLAIAKACLLNGRQNEAMGLLKTVVQNNPDSVGIQERMSGLLKDHGGAELAKGLIESSVKEVIALNNNAVAKAKAGQFAEASGMLSEAAVRLPKNLQVVSNAAISLLVDVLMNGMDHAKLSQAKKFRQAVFKANRLHPKLVEIATLLSKVQTKFHLNGPS